jgi:hypothetical protein
MNDARVMVAIRDPEHVDDLVKLACQMTKGIGAELTGLNVVEVAPALPLDADSDLLDRPGKEALKRAEKVAWDAFGLKLHRRQVRARSSMRLRICTPIFSSSATMESMVSARSFSVPPYSTWQLMLPAA